MANLFGIVAFLITLGIRPVADTFKIKRMNIETTNAPNTSETAIVLYRVIGCPSFGMINNLNNK